MNSGGQPVTRTLVAIDKVLSVLILLMGLFMVCLTLQYRSGTLAVASAVFLGVGYFKLRRLFPGVFGARKKKVQQAKAGKPRP